MGISKLASRAIISQQLMLGSRTLDSVSSYKYLGVLISDDLSWSLHVERISSKARRILGMLYRRFYR